MPKFGPSINDRWKKICEEMSAGAVTAGDGGFTGAADPLGPVAGYDLPFKGTILRRWKEAANKKR